MSLLYMWVFTLPSKSNVIAYHKNERAALETLLYAEHMLGDPYSAYSYKTL